MPDFPYSASSPLLEQTPGGLLHQINHLLGEYRKAVAREVSRPQVVNVTGVPEEEVDQRIEQGIRPWRERAERAERQISELQGVSAAKENLHSQVVALQEERDGLNDRIERIKVRASEERYEYLNHAKKEREELRKTLAERESLIDKLTARVAELEGDREPAEAA